MRFGESFGYSICLEYNAHVFDNKEWNASNLLYHNQAIIYGCCEEVPTEAHAVGVRGATAFDPWGNNDNNKTVL